MGKGAILAGFCALIMLAGIMAGCDRELVPTRDYASTNSPPSRYKVVSSDYYRPDGLPPNFTIIVFTDTQGTNDYMLVETEHGLSTPIVVPKPMKVVEDWRTR